MRSTMVPDSGDRTPLAPEFDNQNDGQGTLDYQTSYGDTPMIIINTEYVLL